MRPRYFVLAGSTYYPAGWDDYRAEFETLSEAEAYAKGYIAADSLTWAEVIDKETMSRVSKFDNR